MTTKKQTILLITIVVIAAFMRLIPHPVNFTPIGALALFAGAYMSKNKWMLIIPFITLFISDIFINYMFYNQFVLLHSTWLFVYAAFGLIIFMAKYLLKKINIASVLGSSVIATITFYLITNAGVWMFDPFNMYPNGMHGLWMSLVAGIPFIGNSLLSTLIYSTVLFGIYEAVIKKQHIFIPQSIKKS